MSWPRSYGKEITHQANSRHPDSTCFTPATQCCHRSMEQEAAAPLSSPSWLKSFRFTRDPGQLEALPPLVPAGVNGEPFPVPTREIKQEALAPAGKQRRKPKEPQVTPGKNPEKSQLFPPGYQKEMSNRAKVKEGSCIQVSAFLKGNKGYNFPISTEGSRSTINRKSWLKERAMRSRKPL